MSIFLTGDSTISGNIQIITTEISMIIKNGNAQKVNSGKGITVENWHTVTVVQKDATCTYYLDGQALGSQAVSIHPSDMAASFTGKISR